MTTLDELEEIKELVNNDKHFKYKNIVNFNCESIEKSLKALDIIKKFIWVEDDKLKCGRFGDIEIELDESDFESKEEFNLLKEVLE